MSRAGLHEYEDWLDTFDARTGIADGEIYFDFEVSFSIPLRDCADAAGIVSCASRLSEFLKAMYCPHDYLIGRFVRLAIAGNHLSLTEKEIYLV